MSGENYKCSKEAELEAMKKTIEKMDKTLNNGLKDKIHEIAQHQQFSHAQLKELLRINSTITKNVDELLIFRKGIEVKEELVEKFEGIPSTVSDNKKTRNLTIIMIIVVSFFSLSGLVTTIINLVN